MQNNLSRHKAGATAWLASGVLGLLAPPAIADFSACASVLTPYEAAYVSTYRGLAMQGRRTLKAQSDGTFVLSHTASKLGNSVTERSVFRIQDNRIRVEKYDMTRSMLGVKREQHSWFDWDKGEVRVTGRNSLVLPLDDQPLDPLSYQLAMRCDFALGKAYGSYPVVTRKTIKHYRFEVTGTERLATDIGNLETLVVERVTDGKRSTRVWLAPDLNYLMVRLEQRETKQDLHLVLEIEQMAFD